MLFNSPVYLFLFLPLVVLIYHALNSKRLVLAAKFWLVLASLFFYGFWNPAYLVLIIGSMTVNFAIGRALHPDNRGYTTIGTIELPRKLTLSVGILFNLGLLCYFKYADFLIANYNLLTGDAVRPLDLVLPLAISFFTFQQIAYLVDSYQADTQEYDFLNYCLFVTFFPQLIAGPIVHHREMMPQFRRPRNAVIDYRNVAMGIFILSLGLLKKIYVADAFAVWANAGFDSKQALHLFEAWGTSLSYTFQLYYDFSGYSDMAIGGALIFNIRLPVNFNSPYKAVNIRDFWQRWHMTLSRWLRDYVYIPLGGNRFGNLHTFNNLLITFLLGGLWHGAGWTFVVWGGLHGVAMCVHRAWMLLGFRMNALLAWLTTFIFINCTWVFFRAANIHEAIRILKGMAGLYGVTRPSPPGSFFDQAIGFLSGVYGNTFSQNPLLIPFNLDKYAVIFGVFALIMPNSLQISGFQPYGGTVLFRKTHLFLAAQSGIMLFAFFRMLSSHPSEFLYFNF
jgi:D-alanyl-lipoteichoic acid acyltransferase DltB (MBOAT superfamily)